MEKRSLTPRERLQICLAGEIPDRVPVALWRHFPVDDQDPETLAAAVIDFQRTYDFDFVKVTPASSYCLRDWGVEDAWRGATEGTREYTRRVIRDPEDWRRLSVLDPYAGHLGSQLVCLRVICAALGPETPVVQTIFNPLSQAKNLVGGHELLVHLRRHPNALHEGLKIIAESTIRFIEAAQQTGIAGIFLAVQHANYGFLSEEEYRLFGSMYDLDVLKAAHGLWLNILHLHGQDVMFDLFADYPIAIINWHDRDTSPSLSEALERFSGVLCGGLQRERTMVFGTPEQVISEARDAIRATGGRRFILGTGCVLPIIAPRANILAARRSVEIGV